MLTPSSSSFWEAKVASKRQAVLPSRYKAQSPQEKTQRRVCSRGGGKTAASTYREDHWDGCASSTPLEPCMEQLPTEAARILWNSEAYEQCKQCVKLVLKLTTHMHRLRHTYTRAHSCTQAIFIYKIKVAWTELFSTEVANVIFWLTMKSFSLPHIRQAHAMVWPCEM